MLRPVDQEYYARRTAEEKERGDQAIDAIVATVHYELARRYTLLSAQGIWTGREVVAYVNPRRLAGAPKRGAGVSTDLN